MKRIKSSRLLSMVGILFVIIGIVCLVNPLWAYVELVRFSGLALLLNGIVLQVSSSSAHITFNREKRIMRIESIADFIFGILLLFNPFMTFILYPLLIGSWILCVGIIKIIASLLVKKQIRGWVFILVHGMLSCIFAIAIIYSPSTRAIDITLIIGVFFLSLGSVLIYDAIRLKRMHETVDLLF
ncbi:MAG TPA: hypothetical protein DIC22_00165 [Chitinophagaceae bacterium]|jgi:uncharacterized membrane protein HdeD (DUF308 family)|nr:hypothetical protein [Chitinophagaceae bacterium]